MAVKAYVAYISKEREVDVGIDIFLVVRHKGAELFVVIACKMETPVGFVNELHCLSQAFSRETQLATTQIEFANNAPCYGITVQEGDVFKESKTFECVGCGVCSQLCGLGAFESTGKEG